MSKSFKIKKKKIIIASIFKTVSDTRMFERFAVSLAQTGKYSVYLAGNKGKYINIHKNIKFKILFRFNKSSWMRLLAPVQFFFYCFKVNPSLVIVCTPELLTPAILYKLIFRAKLIYDLEQNYTHKFHNTRRGIFNKYIIVYVTYIIESISKYFIDKIFISSAEISDIKHMPMDRAIVLENKYKQLYFDNLDENNDREGRYRILVCQHFDEKIHIDTILSYVKDCKTLHKGIYLVFCNLDYEQILKNTLRKPLKKYNYIKLVGTNHTLNHKEISNQIIKSSFVLIHENDIYRNDILSLVYECLATQTPIIHNLEGDIVSLIQKYDGGIKVNFSAKNTFEELDMILHKNYYTVQKNNKDLLWESEEQKLLDNIDEMLAK
ncbi:MAG: hypothetical protein NW207_12325 [Cytophagales bacterium]|nr:hypothetical protein [Cytophagales bacterium]